MSGIDRAINIVERHLADDIEQFQVALEEARNGLEPARDMGIVTTLSKQRCSVLNSVLKALKEDKENKDDT